MPPRSARRGTLGARRELPAGRRITCVRRHRERGDHWSARVCLRGQVRTVERARNGAWTTEWEPGVLREVVPALAVELTARVRREERRERRAGR